MHCHLNNKIRNDKMDLITSVNNSNVKFNFSNTNYNNFPYSLACYKKRFSVCEI